ncbi:MAG TPA: chemotaxis protein CheW [Gemmatimonadales bacterium]|nr:chemotaxis protein CheW [Gemmatimonadales bacterium]
MDGFEALRGEYALDARERLDRVEQSLLAVETLVGEPRDVELTRLKAELHTVKGNSAMMGFTDLQQLAHQMEDAVLATGTDGLDVASLLVSVDRFRRRVVELVADPASSPVAASEIAAVPAETAEAAPTTQTGVRVSFAALDGLIDLVAEMVIERNRLETAIAGAGPDVHLAFEGLERTLELLQERVTALRMTPLHTVFGSLRRIVHDEAHKDGKDARLVTTGGETPLDKALLELANEALGHLVRNAVIHGLEPAAARRAAGKPETGTVRVAAAVRGDEVLIEVAEDGRGIDPEQLRRAAAAKGFPLAPEADPYEVLFESGFSTRGSADLSAGRGVGLAAVREAVLRQGGRIEVRSEIGRGTTFQLWLPLSVSIARSLLLRADDELYALPMALVVDSRRLRPEDAHDVNHAGVIRWRDGMLPLLDLGCHFGTRPRRRRDGYVVVVEAAGKRRGLVADRIQGLQEVVVKGLDPICGRPVGVAGTTVLGDGRPILILDPRSLVDAAVFDREEM